MATVFEVVGPLDKDVYLRVRVDGEDIGHIRENPESGACGANKGAKYRCFKSRHSAAEWLLEQHSAN